MKFESGLINDVRKVNNKVVKTINPKAPHARTLQDYQQIEQLKKHLSQKGISVVFAEEIKSNQIVFPYIDAEVKYKAIDYVSDGHAYIAGQVLGEIHRESPKVFESRLFFDFTTSDDELKKIFEKARANNIKWLKKIDEAYFISLNKKCLSAINNLSSNLMLSHCDFYPHNILWTENNDYYLIDWEFAGLVNPGVEFALGCLAFNNPQFERGYLSIADKPNDDPQDCFWGAINNGWIFWIIYNMKLSLDDSLDQEHAHQAINNLLLYYNDLAQALVNPDIFQ